MDGEEERHWTSECTGNSSETDANSSDWSELTRECLTNVFARLSVEDRWRGAMLVCKSWLEAGKDPSLWTHLDLDPYFDSSVELSRWWSAEFERRVDYVLRSAANWGGSSLVEVRVRHCSDGALISVIERCPKLQVLSIRSSQSITNSSMFALASSGCCPFLKELDISYCHEISHKSLSLLGKTCPNLKILKRNFMNWLDPSQHRRIVPDEYLDSAPQDGDSEAHGIGKSMPRLVHLEIQFSKLTAKGLSSICEGCKDLEIFDISGCANLTSREIVNLTFGLRKLKTIKKPNLFIPRSVFPAAERYGHWNLYDERFQTDIFRI